MSPQPLKIYEFAWSHYCDKVRLACLCTKLKGIETEIVPVNVMRYVQETKFAYKRGVRTLLPIVHNVDTDEVHSDSTHVLHYLDTAYPKTKKLFPADKAQAQKVHDLCIELDSEMGIIARRLGYSQVIINSPAMLTKLFLKRFYPWADLPLLRTFIGGFLGIILMQRFTMHSAMAEGAGEHAHAYLDSLLDRFGDRPYLIGDSLTAADITFLALSRPLRILPSVAEQKGRYHLLWERYDRIVAELGAPEKPIYEDDFVWARSKANPAYWLWLPWTVFWLALAAVINPVYDAVVKAEPVERNTTYKKEDDRAADNDHKDVTIMRPGGLLHLPIDLFNYFIRMKTHA